MKPQKFYQNKLGLDIKFDFSDRGMVAFNVDENEPAIIFAQSRKRKPAIVFTVDDVRRACEILTALPVEFTNPFGNRFGLTDYSKMLQLRGKK